MRAILFTAIALFVTTTAESQPWTGEQRGVIDAIAALSASTAAGGGGSEMYRSMLDPDYSRWTMGLPLIHISLPTRPS